MALRSANVLFALVMLNAAALFVGALPVAEDLGVSPQVGGDQAIEDAEQQAEQVDPERSSLDSFIGAVIEAGDTLDTVFSVITAGPQMLINLGAPQLLVTFISAPLYLFVGLDVLQTISNRVISS